MKTYRIYCGDDKYTVDSKVYKIKAKSVSEAEDLAYEQFEDDYGYYPELVFEIEA